MANEGQAPKALRKINRRGIPVNALVLTTIIGGLAFLTSIFGDQTYMWILNASGLSGFIAWIGIAISHYRFRKAYVASGQDINELAYKAKWFPLGPVLAFGMCLIVILGQNYQAVLSDKIDWYGLTVSYIGLPLFLATWWGYKIAKKTKVVPLHECIQREDKK